MQCRESALSQAGRDLLTCRTGLKQDVHQSQPLQDPVMDAGCLHLLTVGSSSRTIKLGWTDDSPYDDQA